MRQNFEPKVWGPHAWFFLETVAMGYSTDPTYEEKKAAENLAEDMVAKPLDMLERDGLIRVSTDKDGDKEIVPISEIITDALRNVKT